MTIILYAIPGFITLILAEWLYGLARGRNTYRVADTITSFYLQSTWTEGRQLAVWLEWLKLGLVFVIPSFLPLNPAVLTMFHTYLVISVLSLSYLTLQAVTLAPHKGKQ